MEKQTLTNRQRQFRNLMKEAEGINENEKDNYSYRDQRFGSEKPRKRFKKPLLQIGGAVSLLVLLWDLYVFSSYLIPWHGKNKLLSNSHFEVHQYIQKSSEIEMAVNDTAGSLVEQSNTNSLTVFHIEEAQQKLFELQKEGETDDPRFFAMRSYLEEQFTLAYQMTNVLKTEESNAKHHEMNQIISRQHALLARRNAVLINVLESEKIPYEQRGDGAVTTSSL